MVQITVPTTNQTYVFNLHRISNKNQRAIKPQHFPACLKLLLESKDYVKVGCGLATDVAKLKRDYNVNVVDALDIVSLARDKGLMDKGRASLREMCCRFLEADLPKGAFDFIFKYVYGCGWMYTHLLINIHPYTTPTQKQPQKKTDDDIRLSEWGQVHLSAEQKDYAALDAYSTLMVYERVRRKRTVSDYARLTREGAVPGTSVVLLAKTADLEVGRAVIVEGPMAGTARSSRPFQPAYLEGAEEGRVQQQNQTVARAVLRLERVVAGAARLPYPTDSQVPTLAAAWEQRGDDGEELEEGRHVLWDISRLRVPPGGGGGDGGAAAAAGEEEPDAPPQVVTREGTDADFPAVVDEWEAGLALDEEFVRGFEGGGGDGEDEGAVGAVDEEMDAEDDGDAEDEEDEEDPLWLVVGCDASHGPTVKVDMMHIQARPTKTIPKSHGARSMFIARLRDAFMAPIAADVEAVKRRKVAGGMTEEEWEVYLHRHWTDVLKQCRRVVPEPRILVPRLKKLEALYTNIRDAATGDPLFSKKTWARWRAMMRHVEKGCVSDPRADMVPLYHLVGEREDGTPIFTCSRGTSQLEVRWRLCRLGGVWLGID